MSSKKKDHNSAQAKVNNLVKNPVAVAASNIVTTGDKTWEFTSQTADDVRNMIGSVTNIVVQAQDFLMTTNLFTNEANVLVNGLMIDIKDAAEKWALNNKRHEGRTGAATGIHDFNLMTEIGLTYIQIHEELLLKTQYAAPRLQEIVTEAEYRIRGIIMVDPTQDNKPIVSVGTVVPMEMNTNV